LLETLLLGENPISNLSALEGLTHLKWLNLYGNDIEDIASLMGLAGLLSNFPR